MPIKVLLDTDIDIMGDIDDALCLGYLLHQPGCELLGITTVSYDTERRASFASAMCTAAGKPVPILPWAALPLLAPLPRVTIVGWPHEQVFPRGQALELMRRTMIAPR